ncbi:MAG TPA: dihydroorotate dehydrogenase-like protein [Chthoniobacteraceae bacterium]|jgi:dihydroorotate dehydrogenase (fumarate)|nr:dihydroorotate dehydrogenase-like protein [Chthoniobacteraceae bacterium]
MNLSTTYLGIKLRTPLVPSASPLSEDFDNIKCMEDAGASAIVFHSLFEEQIRADGYEPHRGIRRPRQPYPEALTYFPERANFRVTLEDYAERIARAKQSTSIPIIGSLNGSTFGGWTMFAREIEQAGADALELNLYSLPTDPGISAEEIETSYLTILTSVIGQVRIPVAVKLSPYFTNLSQFAQRLVKSGAAGLVLFNRFYQPDIELETREVVPRVVLSTPSAMRLPLRWIAILRGRIGANLAASGGIHRATDALKMLMAGADVTMLCSVLLARGIGHLGTIERELREWMEEHELDSIEQLKGCLSQENYPDPSAYERAQYLRAVSTARTAD